MASIHKSTNYKPTEIPNPFREGQDKALADILLDKMAEMRWWRTIIGLGIIGISLINFFFFIYAVSLQKTVPVLVNVMPSGEAAYLGQVKQTGALQIPEAAILFQLRKFVTNLRNISTDPQVLYNNIDECYAMVTGSYEPLRDNSPFNLVGKTRRTVDIESAIHVTGSSYQLDWKETSVQTSGSPQIVKMRALITIKILPVEDGAVMRKNPLGIFIENCEMTRL